MLKENLEMILNKAKSFGLRDEDFEVSQEYLTYHEYGLCFETIVTQLYEYEIPIDIPFFILLEKVSDEMGISSDQYSFLKDLIKHG